jgi:glycosyltransferase involved in cell wall biosynthesis
MAVGCPVVLTPEVGIAPAVRSAGAGIVSEGEPKQLASAINTLLQDDSLRWRMGEAGRRAAKEDFSWDTIAEQMEALYQRLLNARILREPPTRA